MAFIEVLLSEVLPCFRAYVANRYPHLLEKRDRQIFVSTGCGRLSVRPARADFPTLFSWWAGASVAREVPLKLSGAGLTTVPSLVPWPPLSGVGAGGPVCWVCPSFLWAWA